MPKFHYKMQIYRKVSAEANENEVFRLALPLTFVIFATAYG